MTVVCECPSCEELVERRCPDGNVLCGRLGRGGACPGCGDVVLACELAGGW
jgi:hypothetical protein